MIKNLKSVISLTLICAVVAILLAITNKITAPIIAKQENDKTFEAFAEVLPGGEGFEKVDLSKYELPKTITEVHKENNGGYVIKIVTTGYSSNFVILCGIDKNAVVQGATCVTSGETLGHEKTYGKNFVGKNIEQVDSVDTISNATKTTAAYKAAIKDALNAFTILSGGSADFRTPEEIFNDNLNAALPAAEGKVTKLYLAEEISGIDSVYIADNNVGFVFIIGENFIATDIDGKVISETDATLKETVENTAALILETKIDLTQYTNMPTAVKEAYKNDNGDYVFILHAAGYGINGGDQYHQASGKPIVIRVSATKDGKIIDCVTLAQEETPQFGGACSDYEFSSQFNGKTEENYSEIDAISGATITTNGYKNGIAKIFAAIQILEGVS